MQIIGRKHKPFMQVVVKSRFNLYHKLPRCKRKCRVFGVQNEGKMQAKFTGNLQGKMHVKPLGTKGKCKQENVQER